MKHEKLSKLVCVFSCLAKMPICPLTVPAYALPAVGFTPGYSTFHIKRLRHLRMNVSFQTHLLTHTTQSVILCDITSSWELTRYGHRDTSNDNPMESGFSDAVSKGTCTSLLHCKTSQLLAPKGLLLRLSLLKIKAKACAHVLLDTDLRNWKDVFLSVECFSRSFKFGQSGTMVTCNMLGFVTFGWGQTFLENGWSQKFTILIIRIKCFSCNHCGLIVQMCFLHIG